MMVHIHVKGGRERILYIRLVAWRWVSLFIAKAGLARGSLIEELERERQGKERRMEEQLE